MKTYVKEKVGKGELHLYKILSTSMLQDYNKSFSTLILPKALFIDEEEAMLTLPYYEGKTFNSLWTESNGGASMDLELTDKIPLLIKELASIDISFIMANSFFKKESQSIFDQHNALHEFGSIADDLSKKGFIANDEGQKIKNVLSVQQETKMIINNGDFYPRNFIKRSDGKIVLIDWEAWNPHSPFYIIDHPENVAAVQYVHMWGNTQWQKVYREKIQQHFSFSEESLNKGIAIKALTLAHFFPKHLELFNGQIKILKSICNERSAIY